MLTFLKECHHLSQRWKWICDSVVAIMNEKLRYHEELQHVPALFPALYTLALSRSPHAQNPHFRRDPIYLLFTANHGVCRDFQRFLDSAVIKLNVFNDLICDLSLLCCSRFMRHAVLLAIVQSRWPHNEVDQITNVEKLASLKCNRHLL